MKVRGLIVARLASESIETPARKWSRRYFSERRMRSSECGREMVTEEYPDCDVRGIVSSSDFAHCSATSCPQNFSTRCRLRSIHAYAPPAHRMCPSSVTNCSACQATAG